MMLISPLSLDAAPVAVSFDQPIEMLLACHEKILAQCRTLQAMLRHQQQQGCDVALQQAAFAVLRYFDTAGVYHHQDEEFDLFPLLIDCIDAQELLAEIMVQHQQIAEIWFLLRPQLQQIAASCNASLDAPLLTRFVDLYQQHIRLENERLLPRLSSWLDESQLVELGRSMAARRVSA